jgi:hypothetical protein
LYQNSDPATPPGCVVGVGATATWITTLAVLLVVLLSQVLEILVENVRVLHCTVAVGLTGILTVSDPRDAIVADLVQVTTDATAIPHDHPLSIKELLGPFIPDGSVRVSVVTPVEVACPALVTVIGSVEIVLIARGPCGCPIPGMRSTTFAETYGRSLHSVVEV